MCCRVPIPGRTRGDEGNPAGCRFGRRPTAGIHGILAVPAHPRALLAVPSDAGPNSSDGVRSLYAPTSFREGKTDGIQCRIHPNGPARATPVPGWRRLAQNAEGPADWACGCWFGSQAFRPQSDGVSRFRPAKDQASAGGQVRGRTPAPDTALSRPGEKFAGALAHGRASGSVRGRHQGTPLLGCPLHGQDAVEHIRRQALFPPDRLDTLPFGLGQFRP